MRALAIAFCAAFAWGCSGHDPSNEADAAANGNAETAGNVGAYRCIVRDPTPLLQNANVALVGAPWVTRGPGGFRVYARVGSGQELHWRGPGGEGDVPARVGLREGAFGWAGERFVAVLSERVSPPDDALDLEPDWRGHRVVTFDERHDGAAPVRTALPESACAPAVTEMAGRAMLTWHRRTREGCDGGDGWYQLLGRRGEPLGAAHQLTEGGLDVGVRQLRGRWDFGRAVIVAQRSDTGLDLAWVVDASGEVVWSGSTGGAEGVVACPRGGCLRVRVGHDVATSDGLGGNSLRFERLVGGGAFAVTAPVNDVLGVAVSGDRVLALHSPQVTSAGCDLTVVDLATRAVVAQHHADALSCDERYVRATPRGFVIASADTASGVSRVIDCGQ